MHSESLKINADGLFDAGLSIVGTYTMDGIPLSQLQLCYTSVTWETKCINLIV